MYIDFISEEIGKWKGEVSPMAKKSQKKSMTNRVAPKHVLNQNTVAFKIYDAYRKATNIIERAEVASGKRIIFKSDTGSTINFEINRYGVSSTTAKNI